MGFCADGWVSVARSWWRRTAVDPAGEVGGGGHTGQPPVELPVGADHSRGGTADLLMKWAGSAKVTMDTLFLYLCTGAFHQAFFPLPPWPQPQLAVPYPPVNRPLTNEN